MTRSQRRYHRLLWTLLAPILFALVAGAMLLRPPPLIQSTITGESNGGN